MRTGVFLLRPLPLEHYEARGKRLEGLCMVVLWKPKVVRDFQDGSRLRQLTYSDVIEIEQNVVFGRHGLKLNPATIADAIGTYEGRTAIGIFAFGRLH